MAYTTIKKPSEHFNTKLYTGNGSSQDITGLDFQPDFCWFKRRDTGAANHALQDAVRGVTKFIQSNTTAAEATSSNYLTSFNSDGFSLAGDGDVNENNANHVAWNWKANGAGVANTDGTISSTVSANTTSGFSIVSYTGTGANATVGTGLGATPAMIIVKDRTSGTALWCVYHKSLGTNQNIYLNLTNTVDTPSPEIYRTASMTDNVFAIGSHGRINTSSNNYIAYCFAEKQGYSKFGSYTGNGSTDGTFVYTGFKPAFVMTKRTDTTNSWEIQDSTRSDFNVCNEGLYPDLTNAEGDADRYDLLSNGIKMRTSGGMNASGGSYIYMAFAEQPLVGNNPATAR
jgi:hypothetical protein